MKNCFLIVNYNDYKSTKHLIDNIIGYECIDEILIVDNNSRPKERELLATIKEKHVEIIYNSENLGYSTAINIGSRYLIEKYGKCNLIISNSDIVILSEDDLSKMLEVLNDEIVGLVGPQLLELGNISRGYKNIKPSMDIALNTPLLKNIISEKNYLYNDSYYNCDISYVDVVSSAFFLISSETLISINYLDENVFLYYEDFILSKKVNDLGLLVAICNDVKIKHLYSISVDKSLLESEKYKMLKESQYYYQTAYNCANFLEKWIMNFSSGLGLIIRKVKEYFYNK